ncbi:MAG: hypothetical protein JNK29_02250 [Anaerolineales bacterium]|nr:hypothetical protein [Anaerolineales bacterium]
MSRLAAVLALVGLLAACAPGATPPSESEGRPPSLTAQPPAITATDAPPAAPAITEARAVEVEWPVSVRVGNSDLIRLALVTRPDGYLTPTAEVPGSQTSGTVVEIPNLYDTHTVTAVARLDAAGFEIDRPGEWPQELQPGEPLRWQWTIRAKEAGRQVVVITLRLRFEPKAGGAAREREVFNRALTVKADTVLGLSGQAAQILGGFGSLVGTVLGFPFLDKILAAVWSRVRPKPKPRA